MDKQDMLDTIDSLISCIRGNEDDIDTLVDQQLESMPDSELEAYFRNNQATYYRSNKSEFMYDYLWEFVEY